MSPTTTPLDRAVSDVRARAAAFARSDLASRIALLERIARDTAAVADDWVRASCAAKDIAHDAPVAAEEWLGGPVSVLRNVRLLRQSLRTLARGGVRALVEPVARERRGEAVARVFPLGPRDRLMLPGYRADVLFPPGTTREALFDATAAAYRPGRDERGRVCAVLGAGNVSSIGPMDVLSKAFVENEVAVLKLHPVNDYLGPLLERALSALVEPGFLRIVAGGADTGAHLVHHPDVDAVHLTGSRAVHDAIVWGDDAERRAPRLDKRVTSELGCVTPLVLVPGDWSERELAFQAQNVASMLVNNASFNCNAAKLLVTSSRWPQRERFLERLAGVLASIAPRRAYYPGAVERYERFLGAYADARQYGVRQSGAREDERLPWALACGLDPGADQLAFREEAWCGVLAETALDADGPAFLDEATRLCNERVFGSLSCGVLASPRTLAEPTVAHALERAADELRYGAVAIGPWPALAYALASPPWGAHPGNTLADVDSGIGFVHDTLLFDAPRKTILHGPFVPWPSPPWLATHRAAHRVAARLARLEASFGAWPAAAHLGVAAAWAARG